MPPVNPRTHPNARGPNSGAISAVAPPTGKSLALDACAKSTRAASESPLTEGIGFAPNATSWESRADPKWGPTGRTGREEGKFGRDGDLWGVGGRSHGAATARRRGCVRSLVSCARWARSKARRSVLRCPDRFSRDWLRGPLRQADRGVRGGRPRGRLPRRSRSRLPPRRRQRARTRAGAAARRRPQRAPRTRARRSGCSRASSRARATRSRSRPRG